MNGWQAALAIAGLIVTLVAVVLAAWLSARSVARLCMRREHHEMRDDIERLTVNQAKVLEHLRDIDRKVYGR